MINGCPLDSGFQTLPHRAPGVGGEEESPDEKGVGPSQSQQSDFHHFMY